MRNGRVVNVVNDEAERYGCCLGVQTCWLDADGGIHDRREKIDD